MTKICIVEDEEDIRELVIYALTSAGFEAKGFESGGMFFSACEKESDLPDLILLDINLPENDGVFLLKKIRTVPRYKRIPVIMLTAKNSEYDKVKCLDGGADDYITKPFGVTELISRINAVLRRCAVSAGAALAFCGIVLDDSKRSVTAAGEKVSLTFKEYELLRYLMKNSGLVLSREKLLETVWGYGFEGESRTVDVHIKTLRQKLRGQGSLIKTVRNVGYKLGE